MQQRNSEEQAIDSTDEERAQEVGTPNRKNAPDATEGAREDEGLLDDEEDEEEENVNESTGAE